MCHNEGIINIMITAEQINKTAKFDEKKELKLLNYQEMITMLVICEFAQKIALLNLKAKHHRLLKLRFIYRCL